MVEAEGCERSGLESNGNAAQQGQSILIRRRAVQISKCTGDSGRSGSPARRHYRHGKVKGDRILA